VWGDLKEDSGGFKVENRRRILTQRHLLDLKKKIVARYYKERLGGASKKVGRVMNGPEGGSTEMQ